ncbi:MAG: hypothetical protein NTX30_19505 [Deltaproteobacteria bacterium]|nr:hypothetical protein [Deltaproteobacteria bacterium]
MSEHLVRREEPPPGISSFTKIRLGWISPEQAVLVKPGETTYASLSPLSKKGEKLVVKIPLKGNRYYLVENRQPLGYDRILPDSGLLILKVDPNAPEGYGTAKIMDADPKSPRFSRATFRLDRPTRNLFLDKEANIAVIPLWSEGDSLGVLITTPNQSEDALKAALVIQERKARHPDPREKVRRVTDECIARFKSFDFKACR